MQGFGPALVAGPGGMVGHLSMASYATPTAMTTPTSPQYCAPHHVQRLAPTQYYAGALSPQVQVGVVPRPGMGYYANTMMVNQQAHLNTPYYYAQPMPFPGTPYRQHLHTPVATGRPSGSQGDMAATSQPAAAGLVTGLSHATDPADGRRAPFLYRVPRERIQTDEG